MRLSTTASLFVVLAMLVPASAFALDGIGPRVAVEGTVQSITITKDQAVKEQGGSMIVLAKNGQLVKVDITENAIILFEGKRRRTAFKPADILEGMSVRLRGWRTGTDSTQAAQITILNLEKSSSLTYSGTVDDITPTTVKMRLGNSDSRTFTLTTETEVNVSFQAFGPSGLSLIGRNIDVTLNPQDLTQVRIIRITAKTGSN